MPSKISWTDESINPIVGCSKCSPGCENCYAEDLAKRWKAARVSQYQDVVDGNGWTGKTCFTLKAFERIPKRDPKKIFIGSMTDIFHESVPFEWVDEIMLKIAKYRQHTFQILTKRPDRMKKYFENRPLFCSESDYKYFKNLWLGVTVCNQKEADRNIPILLQTPAAVRFVSIEPQLGNINIIPYLGGNTYKCKCGWHETEYSLCISGALLENRRAHCLKCSTNANIYPALDWVICGGESGKNARPLNPDWVISLRNQCEAANVPFFFKQWGEYRYSPENFDACAFKVGAKKSGNKLQGKTYEQFPEVTK